MTRKNRQRPRFCHAFLAKIERLESRLALSGPSFTVDSNADGGEGTLRLAIELARDLPGLTIDFDLPAGSTTINLLTPLPMIASTVTIDGTSQPGYTGTPLVTVDGAATVATGAGFDFEGGSDGSVIQGLDITGFALYGIKVNGASHVTIGGTSAGLGNIISGNPGDGIIITNVSGPSGGLALGTSGTVVMGNDIGTGPAGIGQDADGVGILIEGATNSTIGGTSAAERNIISGNSADGIDLTGTSGASNTTGNLIEGNYIGTDGAGNAVLGNGGDGVDLTSGASSNTIGGTLAGQGNLIAGNTGDGIAVSGAGTSNNTIAGNQIGTDIAGTKALANGTGVQLSAGATNNIVGGIAASARNLISGNTNAGIAITGAGSAGNTIAGNFIGTDASGQNAVANPIGILFGGGTGTTIGGTAAGAGNVISGNTTAGIELSGTGVTATLIVGNEIGTNAAGTAAVVQPNQSGAILTLQNAGIVVVGSQGTSIGGTTAQAEKPDIGKLRGCDVCLHDRRQSEHAGRQFHRDRCFRPERGRKHCWNLFQ